MTTSNGKDQRQKMLYVQQFQQTRQNQLKESRRLRSAADQNFLICSNEYAEKLKNRSRPKSRSSTNNTIRERPRTVMVVANVPSIVSSCDNINSNNDLSILNVRATSWNPQQSRITRENRDYMTALAKGLTRDDNKPFSGEHGELFSTRWHQHLTNSIYRPSTAKTMSSRGPRPPTSGADRTKPSVSTLIEVNRPTTAPVMVEGRPRRGATGKAKSAAPPRAPPAPLRAPRSIDSSGNFDNLTNSAFLHLTDGFKPSIFKADNHFVHQICSNVSDIQTDILSTSRDSFLDVSTVTTTVDVTIDKQVQQETTDDEDSKVTVDLPTSETGFWQRNAKSGRIEAFASIPTGKTTRENPQELERRMIAQEETALRQREKDLEQFSFDHFPDSSAPVYDYKSPFAEDYDQAIGLQAQLCTTNGNAEWNLKDFYRDVKTPFEHRTNTKVVFERCLRLARLQAATVKWEQRRRQNLITYNRLLKTVPLESSSTSTLTTSFSAKNNLNNEKESRELNELRRELRCNECKRVTCLGNCAPGQDYHLYKRLVSTISTQLSSSSSRQPSLVNGSSHSRDTHRCKPGCTTCSSNHSRTTADIINANAIITSLNNNNNSVVVGTTAGSNPPNRLRSSKTTFSFGQKAQRPAVDLRPRSMHQVTREMKLKFEQANLSPVVVVPLFEDESHSMLTRRSQTKATNGLLPGKSFRSQRRDSLTLIAPQKIFS